jgi:hypothetical protein
LRLPEGEPKCVEELQKLCAEPWGRFVASHRDGAVFSTSHAERICKRERICASGYMIVSSMLVGTTRARPRRRKQHDNKTACLDCVVAREKGGFWTKVNCTCAKVSKFC